MAEQSMCIHGNVGVCTMKCNNTVCLHPCNEHKLNCLHVNGQENVLTQEGKKSVPVYCPCPGIHVG